MSVMPSRVVAALGVACLVGLAGVGLRVAIHGYPALPTFDGGEAILQALSVGVVVCWFGFLILDGMGV